ADDGASASARVPRAGVEERVAQPVLDAVGGDEDTGRALWAFLHGMTINEFNGRFPADADLDPALGETHLLCSARCGLALKPDGFALRGSLHTALDGPDHSCRTSPNEGVAIQCASRSEWNLQAVIRNSSPPSSQIGPQSAAYQIEFS